MRLVQTINKAKRLCKKAQAFLHNQKEKTEAMSNI